MKLEFQTAKFKLIPWKIVIIFDFSVSFQQGIIFQEYDLTRGEDRGTIAKLQTSSWYVRDRVIESSRRMDQESSLLPAELWPELSR